MWLRRRALPAGAVRARSVRLEAGREACANERCRNVARAVSSVPQDILSTPEVHINVVAVVAAEGKMRLSRHRSQIETSIIAYFSENYFSLSLYIINFSVRREDITCCYTNDMRLFASLFAERPEARLEGVEEAATPHSCCLGVEGGGGSRSRRQGRGRTRRQTLTTASLQRQKMEEA